MTRSMLVVGCAILLASPGLNAWAEDPKPEEIIDRAIKAHGGDEKLKGLTQFTYKSRTTFVNGPSWNYDYVVDAPLRYRSQGRTGVGAMPATLVVIDDTQGWFKTGGAETTPYPPVFLNSMKRYTIPYLGPRSILKLRDRQKNTQCHFSTTGDCTIDGHPAVGLRMKLQDGPQETWYFDKETGVLLKEEYSTKRFEGEDTMRSTTYEDYKSFEGFPMACKSATYQDGKLTSTWELVELKVGSPGPEAFAKP